MSRWDDLENLAGPTDAELRASQDRGAEVARQKRRVAALRSKASLTPAEQSELAALLQSLRSPD